MTTHQKATKRTFYKPDIDSLSERTLQQVHYLTYLFRNVNIMKGVLWKWTNYWSGWQMRWFVLDNGVLSYYKSQEEVNQGCKGSLKVSACEIIVHPTDHTRLEIAIPGEQHMYLKAPSKQERQQWLVALGSSKACMMTKGRRDSDSGNSDSLKSKKSQLRLYCDLLMQQVHQVKTCANDENGVDITKLNEATSLLTITCDTFIETLEDCMKLADSNFLFELSFNHSSGNALPQGYHQKIKPTVPVMKRSSSYESSDIKPSEKKDKLTT